jgi:hypothetical protein
MQPDVIQSGRYGFCDCGKKLPVKAYMATRSSPYRCKSCENYVYWNRSFGSSYFQLLFGALLVLSFILFLKQAWEFLIATVSIFLVGLCLLWIVDTRIGKVVVSQSDYSELVSKSKKKNETAFLVMLLMFLAYVLMTD